MSPSKYALLQESPDRRSYPLSMHKPSVAGEDATSQEFSIVRGLQNNIGNLMSAAEQSVPDLQEERSPRSGSMNL